MPSPENGYTQLATTAIANAGDSLVGDYKWGGAVGSGVTLTYSFPWSGSKSSALWAGDYSSNNEPAAAYALSSAQQAAFRAALAKWSDVANVSFNEVTDTASNVGDIRVAWTTVTQTSSTGGLADAWAYYPSNYYADGGDIWLSQQGMDGANPYSWQAGGYTTGVLSPDAAYSGGYAFLDLMHELGHALGLQHPFDADPALPAGYDSAQYTIMSYTDHPHSRFLRVVQTGGGGYSWYSFTVVPDTPMLYDIRAMQYLYGANLSYRAGDDVYTFDPNAPFFRTLWDAGGNDTISVSNFSKACLIDLREGHFSNITIQSDPLPAGANGIPTPTYDGTDNLAIAYGVTVENAIGGSGGDTLIGNAARNSFVGGAGNDTLVGGAGTDTATYAGSRAGFGIGNTSGIWTVKCNIGDEGTDTLTDIERVRFADVNLALDMGVSDPGGETALLIGAVLGRAGLQNKALVGGVLGYFDSGAGLQDAAELLVNSGQMALLAGGPDNKALVDLLFRNVVGSLPDPVTEAALVNLLETRTYTQPQFLAAVCGLALNQDNVALSLLQSSGFDYV